MNKQEDIEDQIETLMDATENSTILTTLVKIVKCQNATIVRKIEEKKETIRLENLKKEEQRRKDSEALTKLCEKIAFEFFEFSIRSVETQEIPLTIFGSLDQKITDPITKTTWVIREFFNPYFVCSTNPQLDKAKFLRELRDKWDEYQEVFQLSRPKLENIIIFSYGATPPKPAPTFEVVIKIRRKV